MTGPDLPLEGFQIAVTSYRRAEDLVEALTRRGARVLHTPVLRMVPPAEDGALLNDTRAIIAGRPDTVAITTGYGLRRWLEAADAAGLLEDLMEVLGAARLLIRGPKARGAVRAAGLDDTNAVEGERIQDLIDLLLAEGVAGRTVAVQLYGYTDEVPLEHVRAAGGQVLTVEPYRWAAHEARNADELVAAVLAERIDAITFTSAPAVDALLGRAQATGHGAMLLTALREGAAVTAAVGPVTAAPLEEAGITPVVPERHRMGALIRTLTDHLVAYRTAAVETAAGSLEVRGRAVRLGGQPTPLAPTALKILNRLVATPGRLVTREELLHLLPEGTTDHGLDVAISRLRSGLPAPKLIRTVVKRGYLLEIQPG
jgi:uroporphyrinogen-III synthase